MEYFWVYMLRCSDGSYYVGHTDDIEKRMSEHRCKKYSCYTAIRLPFELVYSQSMPSRVEAIEGERKIKGWSRQKKEALIARDWKAVSQCAKKKFK